MRPKRVFTKMRALRELGGMSQAELAAAVGVSQGKISAWESRSSRMPDARVKQVAALLGCTAGELLEGIEFSL